MEKLLERWKKFVVDMNAKGIPVPMIRDAKTGLGSVSLTLVFLSFNMWVLSVIGKAAGALGGISTSETLNMFMVCAGLYFGRKMQRNEKGTVTSLEDKESKQE